MKDRFYYKRKLPLTWCQLYFSLSENSRENSKCILFVFVKRSIKMKDLEHLCGISYSSNKIKI